MGFVVNRQEDYILGIIDFKNRHKRIKRVQVVHKKKRSQSSSPDPSEYAIHCQIADYLNLVIKKPSRWWSIEVSNQQSGVIGMIKQNKLKRKGVLTGTPDIQVIWRPKYGTMSALIFLEVKTATGKLTEVQEALHAELREECHYVYVVRSVSDVEDVLKKLGVI